MSDARTSPDSVTGRAGRPMPGPRMSRPEFRPERRPERGPAARRARLGALLAVLAVALAACNTVAGAGRDLSAAGRVIADGAEKTKRAIAD